MGITGETAALVDVVEKLGFSLGDLVQEFGYDDDIDFKFRDALQSFLDTELIDQDAQEVVDGVILWWRDDDGDLVDVLVDVQTTLEDGGNIWILCPKPGREGHVSPTIIDSAAPVAGLHATSSVNSCKDWNATRLVARKNKS